MQMKIECLVRQKFINQQSLILMYAIPDQEDQISVVDPTTNYIGLCSELFVSLAATQVQFLNNNLVSTQCALINKVEPALVQQI
jgi:hypothetical protein